MEDTSKGSGERQSAPEMTEQEETEDIIVGMDIESDDSVPATPPRESRSVDREEITRTTTPPTPENTPPTPENTGDRTMSQKGNPKTTTNLASTKKGADRHNPLE